ncbi:GH17954 [Drosophila grimshawi]|uniref:GH17954 n=1 Tax=Drosophila grimshawi TaxID=7222 RepID=B4JXH0_DROGR|nr:GH17954 [Drosophila grimshawi]
MKTEVIFIDRTLYLLKKVDSSSKAIKQIWRINQKVSKSRNLLKVYGVKVVGYVDVAMEEANGGVEPMEDDFDEEEEFVNDVSMLLEHI